MWLLCFDETLSFVGHQCWARFHKFHFPYYFTGAWFSIPSAEGGRDRWHTITCQRIKILGEKEAVIKIRNEKLDTYRERKGK